MTWMYLTIFDEVEKVLPEGMPKDAASLYCAFEQVTDGRKKRGVRYPLPLILTLLMRGKLAGETTISGVVDWVKERETWVPQQ